MKKEIIVILLTLLFPLTQSAQQHYVDLSYDTESIKTVQVSAGESIELIISNKIPTKKYKVSIIKSVSPIATFQLQSVKSEEEIAPLNEKCEIVNNLGTALFKAGTEAEVASTVSRLKSQRQSIASDLAKGKPTTEGCQDDHIEIIDSLIGLTRETVEWNGKLRSGEQLEMIVTRTENDITNQWVYVFKTQSRGIWQTSFGFAFIFDVISKEQLYYTKQADSGFVITKQSHRDYMKFAPSIFFTWMPSKCLNSDISWGVSGGIGFDFQSPTVFLGPSISYNQNLKLQFGLVASKQLVLKGKYSEGDIVSTALESTDIHESIYRPNLFLSLSYRFGQNPFNKVGG